MLERIIPVLSRNQQAVPLGLSPAVIQDRTGKDGRIVSTISENGVIAQAARDRIIAVTCIDMIVADPRDDRICAIPAVDLEVNVCAAQIDVILVRCASHRFIYRAAAFRLRSHLIPP